MFKTVNPYDEVVAKATDEKQTVENWDILLTVWDKVNDDGEAGARNCVNALQKRLSHRSANVQLFSLTLADALVNNCGPSLHREVSGKQFTQTLYRLATDRNTHDSVKRKAIQVIRSWCTEHKNDPNFDLMVETYDSLKQNSQLRRMLDESGTAAAPGPSAASSSRPSRSKANDDEELRKREEEDLQRALAESAKLAESSNTFALRKDAPFSTPSASTSAAQPQQRGPEYVRAMYDFNGSSPDELSLRKGEVVKIVETIYAEWWKGELRGRVGIFPSSYVEKVDAPSSREPEKCASMSSKQMSEAEMEAQLFAQSAAIDRLLDMMRSLERSNENPAENEELLELYQKSMALRPKVVKLIEKYNQKQIELRAINDKFTVAKQAYDQMLDESMQRYRSPPQQQQAYQQQPYQQQAAYAQPYGAYAQPYPATTNGMHPQAGPPQHQYHQQPQIPPVQQQGPPAHHAQPTPAAPAQQAGQPQQQGPDPAVLAQMSPEQRQEYERQWAEYQVELAKYYASIGQPVPQQQQQQQGPGPDPAPQQPSTSPVPSVHSTGIDRRSSYGWSQQQQQGAARPVAAGPPGVVASPPPAEHHQSPGPAPLAPSSNNNVAPQPYWDGQAWVYPTQTNAVTNPHEAPAHIEHHHHHHQQAQAYQQQQPQPQLQHKTSNPGSYPDASVDAQLNGPMAAMSVGQQQPYAAPPQQAYAQPYGYGPGQ